MRVRSHDWMHLSVGLEPMQTSHPSNDRNEVTDYELLSRSA